MAKGLERKTIAIAGSRKTDEISTLIEKQGGIPIVRPLQGTVFLAEEQVEPDLRKFVETGADWVVLTTGIGTNTLLDLTERMNIKDLFLQRIQEAKIASRGYKTFSALKKLGINPVAVDEDGTTRGLIRALESFDFSGQRVMVQLHGEKAPALIQFLNEKGATVQQILPYQHIAPERKIVSALCDELINDQVDAVCFTTAVQVRELFDYARENEYLDKIIHAFKSQTLAAAVGKVTAEALKEEGIERMLVPEKERMGAMVIELSRYYSKQDI
ncbi:uroporphyrinogen-III synthase [Jeotgalibacillus soli]|uniref:Uroporphyrinogen-III synthase n=1 Tax=Jeotgalibacillus soli TaxID=889306 RepID=A0A0C2R204_9BACL|nr:uroporphyrinogen-III synthase [Jeotgalibacillus soli]KIL44340.1 uroporphyrinogen-III synthase [Jeotgalibacillus soli]